jgi:hypothetical protein
MKKTSKILALILLVVIMFLSTPNVVKANPDTNSAVFALTSSTKELKVGDEIEINIVINSITGFDGIRVFRALKEYDTSVFEYLGSEGKNGWSVKGDDARVVIEADKDYGAGTTIGVLKFKVLKAINSTVIKLTELDAASIDGENDVYFDDNNVNSPEITFQVLSSETTSTTNTVIQTPTITTNTTATTTKPTNNDKTTATATKMPQTGESYVTIIMLAVVAVLSISLYIKYRTYNKIK